MVKIFTIKRIAYIQDGTFGVFLNENNIPFALTLEREWLKNQRGISCIPDGVYICSRIASPKFGNTFEVKNVPNRSEILFHKGNLSDDTHGCILVGEQFEPIGNKTAIISSTKGYGEFLNKLKDDNHFELKIKKA